ncbi:Uncharacterized protein Rumeso_04105 [Rubellimicrobium mesophilum DSM 19309]|uniref:GH16 domain-containing protein n=1 Tax=Rubellimicrobium mesophilum DSM 19309 TaxID=442562 RepID=A0A017HKL6_9RHOB|nr:family 16 glycosylhydrolase [Rubellimicrobium mesophilum]EYD74324.1 Uncharacterized protein Rumeso_04105 [Rubellimicrobium mesophilum DSM 19309]
MQFRLYKLSQPVIDNGWLIANWDNPLSPIHEWQADNVFKTTDGGVALRLDRSGSKEPYAGGQIRSEDVDKLGTWSWTAQAPKMVNGEVFGMFMRGHEAGTDRPLEFDWEFVGKLGNSRVKITAHMEDAAGHHIKNFGYVDVGLGFDASKGFHRYETTVTATEAVFRVDGKVVQTIDRSDMPGGVWYSGPMRSYVNLWATDPQRADWSGVFTGEGLPLTGHLRRAETPGVDYNPPTTSMKTIGTETSASMVADDILVGRAGDDSLKGGVGDDVIKGLAGDDRLGGGDGADRLQGGGGADILDAGVDDDRDAFVFGRSVGDDRLVNFDPGEDVIRMTTDSVTGLSQEARAHSLWTSRSGDDVIVHGDVDGDAVADFQVTLLNVDRLTADDFEFA